MNMEQIEHELELKKVQLQRNAFTIFLHSNEYSRVESGGKGSTKQMNESPFMGMPGL